MNYKPSVLISTLSLAAVLFGGLIGYFFPDFMLSIEFIGLIFIHGLKFLVLPLIVAVVITGIAALADTGKLNRSIGKLFLYFGATTLGAIVIGLIAVLSIQPGYLSGKEGAFIPSSITDLNDLSFSKIISDIIPGNFLAASTEHQVIGLIIFSILIGGALITLSRKGKLVVDFFEGVKLVTSRISGLFIWIAPFGLFSLVGTAFARNYHTEPIYTNLASFSVTILLAIVIHFLVVLPIVLKLMGKQSPVSFYRNLLPAFTTAFGTGSSVATLPVTNECLNEGTDIDERATSLALPLGSIFNLNGSAIYLIVGSIFIAQLFGQDLSILFVLQIILVSLLVSIGGSLIPNSSLLLMAVVLSLSGFPAQTFAGLGLLLVVDWLFDRLKVVVNVAGDAVGAAVLGETFDFKTATRTLAVGRALKDDRKSGSRFKKDERSSSSTSRGKYSRDEKPAPFEKTTRKKRTKPERKSAADKRQTADRDAVSTKKPFERKERPQRPDTAKPKFEEKPKREDSKPTVSQKSEPTEKPVKANKSSFDITKPPAIPQAIVRPKTEDKPKADNAPKAESKPKDEAKPKADYETKTSSPSPVVFSPETIERERAKISAHLEALKQKEKFKNYLEQPVEPETSEVEDEIDKVQEETTSARVDYVDNSPEPVVPEPEITESKPEETEAVAEEKTEEFSAVEEKPDEPEQKEDEPIVYGRTKPKRPAVKKATAQVDDEAEEKEKESVTVPEFDSEKISFGRTKRKK